MGPIVLHAQPIVDLHHGSKGCIMNVSRIERSCGSGQKGTRSDCLDCWLGRGKLRWRNRLAFERQQRDGSGRCRPSRQTPDVRISSGDAA